jgi:hypothetical protein
LSESSDPGEPKSVRFASGVWQAGFTIIPNVVLLEGEVRATTKLVYFGLLHYAREEETCWPGQAGLASQLGVGEATVRRAVREMEDGGLLRTERRGFGRTNVYVLLAPRARPVNLSGMTGQFERSGSLNLSDLYEEDAEKKTQVQTPSPRRRASEEAREDVDGLCALLAEHLDQLHVRHSEPTAARWRREMRLLLDRDGRRRPQAEAVIRWALADEFWSGVVHSPAKLRKHYDALRHRMQHPARRQGFEHPLDRRAREIMERRGGGDERRPGRGPSGAAVLELSGPADR